MFQPFCLGWAKGLYTPGWGRATSAIGAQGDEDEIETIFWGEMLECALRSRSYDFSECNEAFLIQRRQIRVAICYMYCCIARRSACSCCAKLFGGVDAYE